MKVNFGWIESSLYGKLLRKSKAARRYPAISSITRSGKRNYSSSNSMHDLKSANPLTSNKAWGRRHSGCSDPYKEHMKKESRPRRVAIAMIRLQTSHTTHKNLIIPAFAHTTALYTTLHTDFLLRTRTSSAPTANCGIVWDMVARVHVLFTALYRCMAPCRKPGFYHF